MHEEYFGHVLAGLRFGASLSQFLQTVTMAFDIAGTQKQKEV